MSAPVKATVYVIYYSMYGHLQTMAREALKGAQSAGVNAKLFQVQETLPQEVLGKMHAPAKAVDVPVITAAQLPEADGFIFCYPTRFGGACAQMKAFFDSTGQLWQTGALCGKTVSTIVGTASQGGGQETTHANFTSNFVHHGLIHIPIGYSSPILFGMDEIRGGCPWGAGTLAGADGKRQPIASELALALHQGKYFSDITNRLKTGTVAVGEKPLAK